LDYDDDGEWDADEPSVRTDADGNYSLTGAASKSGVNLVAVTDSSTIDTSSGSVLADVVLSAPATASVVSMASTLMVESDMTEAQVQEALGIVGNVDLLSYNPYDIAATVTDAQKQLARDVEVTSQKVSAVVTSMAAAAKASGVSAADSFKASLEAVSTFVKEQSDASAAVDLTDTTQLTAVADKVATAVTAQQTAARQAVIDAGLDPDNDANYAAAGVAKVTATAFDGVKSTIVTAVKNVNDVIDTVTKDDFSASESVYSVAQALVEQVSEATTKEVATPGTGLASVTFTNSETVKVAKSNPAPTDIDLTVNGTTLDSEASDYAGVLVSEGTSSPEIASIKVFDLKADSLGGLTTETSFTYTLSGTDASSFTITDGVLYFNSQPDYEEKSSYEITISAKDSGEKSFAEKFTINVSNVDEAIVNLAVSKANIDENLPGTTVGQLSATDPENGLISYRLAASGDYELFEITSNGILKLKDEIAADYESQSSYAITVRASDGVNITEKAISVTVDDVNEVPSISASPVLDVTEDSGVAASGTLVASDPDGPEGLVFEISGASEVGSNLVMIGSYGTLTLNKSTGAFSYELDDANSSVNALSTDEKLTETFSIHVSDGELSSVPHELSIGINGVNDAPNIELSNAIIFENDVGAQIDTFNVIDPEGATLTYSLASGGDNELFEITANGVLKLKEGTSADYETQSNYALIVRASDGVNNSEKSITVIVENKNEFPILAAPSVGNITEDSSLDLSGMLTAEDPDGPEGLIFQVSGASTLGEYQVAVGNYGTLRLDKTTGIYSYELDNTNTLVNALAEDESLTENFSVQVSDGTLTSSAQSLSVQIAGINDAPVVSFVKSSLKENDIGTNVGTLAISDPEGVALTTTLASGGDNELFEITSNGILKLKDEIAADYESQSSYAITVRASDGVNITEKAISVTVDDVNEVPSISASPVLDVTEDSGVAASGTLVASDPDGPEGLVFEISGASEVGSNLVMIGSYGTLTLNKSTGAFSYELDDANSSVNALSTDENLTETFSIHVSDGELSSVPHELAIGINGVNDALADLSITNLNIPEYEAGVTVGTITVTDPEGATLTYSLASGGDNELFEITSNGELKLKNENVADFNSKDSYSISITVTDGVHSVSNNFDILVTEINLAPTLSISTEGQQVNQDALFSLTLPENKFLDADGETPSISSSLVGGTSLPSWLSFDAETRTYSGTPTNADVGTLHVSVLATDRGALTAEDQFSLTISNINDAPTFTNEPNLIATEDSVYSYSAKVSDVDTGDRVTVIAESKPNWLSFNATLRLLSGIPTNSSVGDHTVILKAIDYFGAETLKEFVISVENVNDAPSLSQPIPDQSFQEDSFGSFTFGEDVFSDIDVSDTLNYSAALTTGGAIPAWLSFNAATRTFSGTPAAEDVGSQQIILTATDSGGLSASDQITLNVSYVNHAPVAQSARSDMEISVGDNPFEINTVAEIFSDVDVQYGDSLTYTASLQDGSSLPSWIVIDSVTGVLSGIAPKVDVRVNPSTQNLDPYDSVSETYDSDGMLRYETTYVTVTATDKGGLTTSTDIGLAPKGLAKIYTSTISLKDYPVGSSPTETVLSTSFNYREGTGNVLQLETFNLDNANLQLAKDKTGGSWNTSTWPTSPEISINLSQVDPSLNFGNLGEISIFLGEVNSHDGSNHLTVEADERYVELKFTADAVTDADGQISLTFNSRLEGDIKYSANSTPLLASVAVSENETLKFVSGTNGAPDQLQINVLDLLDQLPFNGAVGALVPFETGDFYVALDGLPLQTDTGEFVDLIDAQFSIV